MMLIAEDGRVIVPTKCHYWWDRCSGIMVITLEDNPHS